jgi:hypothetical protein
MSGKPTNGTPPPLGAWPLLLGAIGFAAGFFGPIFLNPDANQGPLVGIFITGPGGALAGLILGVLMRLSATEPALQWRLLAASCALLGVGTLIFCLPEPAWRGEIIEAEVMACYAPEDLLAPAIERWEQAVANAPWANVPANWQERIPQMLASDAGVVLAMRVHRQSRIYERRRPWNRGEIFVTPLGAPAEPVKRYFARDASRDCTAYQSRGTALYHPRAESAQAPTWPPSQLPNFLSLTVLGPVPAHLLPPGHGDSANPS